MAADARAAGAAVAAHLSKALAGKVPKEVLDAVEKVARDERLASGRQDDMARRKEARAIFASKTSGETGKMIEGRSCVCRALGEAVTKALEAAAPVEHSAKSSSTRAGEEDVKAAETTALAAVAQVRAAFAGGAAAALCPAGLGGEAREAAQVMEATAQFALTDAARKRAQCHDGATRTVASVAASLTSAAVRAAATVAKAMTTEVRRRMASAVPSEQLEEALGRLEAIEEGLTITGLDPSLKDELQAELITATETVSQIFTSGVESPAEALGLTDKAWLERFRSTARKEGRAAAKAFAGEGGKSSPKTTTPKRERKQSGSSSSSDGEQKQ